MYLTYRWFLEWNLLLEIHLFLLIVCLSLCFFPQLVLFSHSLSLSPLTLDLPLSLFLLFLLILDRFPLTLKLDDLRFEVLALFVRSLEKTFVVGLLHAFDKFLVKGFHLDHVSGFGLHGQIFCQVDSCDHVFDVGLMSCFSFRLW